MADDQSPARPADGLTPEQEEVRRLLADARHSGPMPDDVAVRLDRVLAGLGAGTSTAGSPEDLPGDRPDDLPDRDPRDSTPLAPTAAVVPLAAARRRRRAATVLVAAAAVVAVGIGLGQVVEDGLGMGGGAESAGDASAGGAQEESGPLDRDSRPRKTRPDRSTASMLVVDQTMARPLRPGRFSSDVQRIRRQVATLDGDALVAEEDLRGPLAASGVCLPARRTAGTVVPVRYRGEPAVLVFRPPRGNRQVVELFRCGSPEALRSVTLPAP